MINKANIQGYLKNFFKTNDLRKFSTYMRAVRNRFPLIALMPIKDYGDEIKEFIHEISGRPDVPQGDWVPEHLRDHEPNFRGTRNGFRVMSYLTPDDVDGLTLSPGSLLLMIFGVFIAYIFAMFMLIAKKEVSTIVAYAGYALVAVAVLNAILYGSIRKSFGLFAAGLGIGTLSWGAGYMQTAGINPSFVFVPMFAGFAFAPWLYVRHLERKRDMQILQQNHEFTAEDAAEARSGLMKREMQARQVRSDMDKGLGFLKLGETKGAFRDYLSASVPDAGKEILLSTNDLQTHLYVFGTTGSGKSATLRGIISQYVHFVTEHQNKYGMFIEDYKGALSYEVERFLDFHLTPKMSFNAFTGLLPEDIAHAIYSRHHIHGDKNAYFTHNAARVIRYSLILLHFFNQHFAPCTVDKGTVKLSYNPGGLIRLVQRMEIPVYRKEILLTIEQKFPQYLEDIPKLKEAYTYFYEEIPNSGDEQVKSFFSSAKTWLSEFTEHPDLAHWAEAEDSPFVIDDCFLKGKRIGIGVGDVQGKTGVLYLFLINRAFKQCAKRMQHVDPAKINRCLFVMDESAGLLRFGGDDGYSDEQIVSIARTILMDCVFATQSVSQLYGMNSNKDLINGFLGNFKTLLVLTTQEEATYQVCNVRIGKGVKMTKKGGGQTAIDYVSTFNNKAKNPIYDGHNQSRERLKAMFGGFGLSLGYKHNKAPVGEFEIKMQGMSGDGNQDILNKQTLTDWVDVPRVALVVAGIGGGIRTDFIEPYAVDKAGRPYNAKWAAEFDEKLGQKRLTETVMVKGFDDITGDPIMRPVLMSELVEKLGATS